MQYAYQKDIDAVMAGSHTNIATVNPTPGNRVLGEVVEAEPLDFVEWNPQTLELGEINLSGTLDEEGQPIGDLGGVATAVCIATPLLLLTPIPDELAVIGVAGPACFIGESTYSIFTSGVTEIREQASLSYNGAVELYQGNTEEGASLICKKPLGRRTKIICASVKTFVALGNTAYNFFFDDQFRDEFEDAVEGVYSDQPE